MTNVNNNTIGKIVAENYKTATIFKKYGIDFCCKGNRSLEQVCANKNIDIEQITIELNKAVNNTTLGSDINFNSWDLDLLTDYIEKTHHRYVENKIPEIKAYLEKTNQVHGAAHTELAEIEALFNASAGELTAHMKKEELVLFPFIRKMVKSKMTNVEIDLPHFGTVQNPINMMLHEHDTEGERFRKIAALSDNYTPPADACNTYKVAFALLQEFETDLHKHIHLENNILFPKAIEMERAVHS